MQAIGQIERRPAAGAVLPGASQAYQATRIACLFSRYPAVSHTFFLAEVTGLRSLGLHIQTASINPPDRTPQQLSPAEVEAAETTCYIKPASRLRGALAVLRSGILHPAVLARGLRAVLTLPLAGPAERAKYLLYLGEAMLLGTWMRQQQLPHLHVHFGGPVASVAMLTSIAFRIPYSLTVHGPEELLDTTAHQLREKVARASFVICISDFCRSQLMRLAPPERWPDLHVVRLGVSPALFRAPAPPTPRNAVIRVVCTGRLVPEKAQRTLIDAVTLLRARNQNISLDLIGEGPDREALLRHIHACDAAAYVRLLGAVPHRETLQHVTRADIFALPSLAEGIPVSLMEAMALGVPCVSTPVAGVPELIRHGQSGLLVAPGNVEELASALDLLCAQPELRTRIATAATERVATAYNLEANHRQLAELLSRSVAPSRFIAARRGAA